MDILHFVYLFVHQWTLGLAVTENIAINIDVHIFVWTSVFISLCTYIGVELLGHIVTLCFVLCQAVFQSGCTLYNQITVNCRSKDFKLELISLDWRFCPR